MCEFFKTNLSKFRSERLQWNQSGIQQQRFGGDAHKSAALNHARQTVFLSTVTVVAVMKVVRLYVNHLFSSYT
jgi:hypothetical protein